MFIRKLKDCEEFIAGDNVILREILHPAKADLELRYSLAHAVVKPGQISYRHCLTISEVYYILDGKGLMFINSDSKPVSEGDTVYIPPNATQCIQNTGSTDLVFLCIVDPAWCVEDEKVLI